MTHVLRFQHNEKNTHLQGTHLQITSNAPNDIELSDRFKKWAKQYELTDFEALAVFYYGQRKFETLQCTSEDYANGRTKLVSCLGSLSGRNIKL